MKEHQLHVAFAIKKRTERPILEAYMTVDGDEVDISTLDSIRDALKEHYQAEEITIICIQEMPIKLTRREE